jgi:hypothetical protein
MNLKIYFESIFLLCVNLFLFLVYSYANIERPIFVYEYFILSFIAYHPFLKSIFLCFLIFYDLILYIFPIINYRFVSFVQIFYDIFSISIVAGLFILALIFLLIYLINVIFRNLISNIFIINRSIIILCFCIFIYITDSILFKSTSFTYNDSVVNNSIEIAGRPVNFGSSYVFNYLNTHVMQNNRNFEAEPISSSRRITSATEVFLNNDNLNHKFYDLNLVLVIVESMAAYSDDKLNDEDLFSLFLTLEPKYFIKHGLIPFAGGTPEGEIRELCNSSIPYDSIDQKIAKNCIPYLLKEHGFYNVAIHGFKPNVFNREVWYPKLGFDKFISLNDFDSVGLTNRCGSAVFRGGCDFEVPRIIHSILQDDSKNFFIHWVTLNTHFPLNPNDLQPQLVGVCDEGPNYDLCLYREILRQTLKSVIELARTTPSTNFIIVGDHRPRFIRPSHRKMVSANNVPYILMSPRF